MTLRCVLLGASLLFSVFTAQTSRADAPIYARLVVPVFFESEIPSDISIISDAVRQLTEAKIGASVELVPLLYMYREKYGTSPMDMRRIAELEMLQKQGVIFDVTPDILPGYKFIELDNLADIYGRNTIEAIDPFMLEFCRSGGTLVKLPSVSGYVASAGVTMRKDIVDKYSIDLSKIRSIFDLDPIFELVGEKEPQMKMVCPYQTRQGFLEYLKLTDAIPSSIFDVDTGKSGKIVNYYATEEYKKYTDLFRKWNERGYLPENMAFQNMRASQLVNADKLFAYFSAYRPGINYDESVSCGRDMITISLMEPVVTRSSLSSIRWGVSETCKNPGKAMKFLDLLYSDEELANLLIYGVPGLHYQRNPDGTATYLDGIDERNVAYKNTMPWILPNRAITCVPPGNDPRLWKDLREFNKFAKVSENIEFKFDPNKVKYYNDSLNEIANRYAYGLETGQLDPSVYLSKMLSEMKTSGADIVQREVQSQYDAFLERRQHR